LILEEFPDAAADTGSAETYLERDKDEDFQCPQREFDFLGFSIWM
jgi:hypothetical protein